MSRLSICLAILVMIPMHYFMYLVTRLRVRVTRIELVLYCYPVYKWLAKADEFYLMDAMEFFATTGLVICVTSLLLKL